MFENCLVESKSVPISATRQWTAVTSIAIQSAAAALIVVLPLLHPERLPIHIDPPHVFMPRLPKPVIHVQPAATSSSATSSVSAAAAPQPGRILSLPNSHNFPATDDPAPPLALVGPGMREGASLPAAITAAENTTTVSRAPVHSNAHPRISAGVAAGMLLTPIRPVYPAIARAAHVEGTVVVEATISRAGTIESLHVVSGPEMLRRAAIDAIQSARYQPYCLNGEPVDVQTSITVNFRLGS